MYRMFWDVAIKLDLEAVKEGGYELTCASDFFFKVEDAPLNEILFDFFIDAAELVDSCIDLTSHL